MGRRVVITGRALNTPLGSQCEDVIARWHNGHSQFIRDEMGYKQSTTPYVGLCNVDAKNLYDRKVQKSVTRKDVLGLGRRV